MSQTEPTPSSKQEYEYDDDVKYMDIVYHREIDFLKTKQELLKFIVDGVADQQESDTAIDAYNQLEKVNADLNKLEGLRDTIALVKAWDIVKKTCSSSKKPDQSTTTMPKS